MNWADASVLIIIIVFTFIGLRNGFLYSVFRLVSYVLSIIFAIKFYPVLSGILQKTVIFTKVKNVVANSIIHQQATDGIPVQQRTAQTIVDGLQLPGFIKDSIIDSVGRRDIFGIQKIIDAISTEIAMLVMNILSVILIYLIIRFGLIFAKIIIKTIAKIPVFKQLDKAGGVVLGAIEGIFVVYILCALLILFSAFPKFSPAIDSIGNSAFAYYFYQNNFIVSWIAPDQEQLDSQQSQTQQEQQTLPADKSPTSKKNTKAAAPTGKTQTVKQNHQKAGSTEKTPSPVTKKPSASSNKQQTQSD